MTFEECNQEMTKKNISGLINSCYRKVGLKESVMFADQLMYEVKHSGKNSIKFKELGNSSENQHIYIEETEFEFSHR